MMSISLMFLLFASFCNGFWITRFLFRSDFFCATNAENYESWLIDPMSGTSACIFSLLQNGTEQWRMVRVVTSSNGVANTTDVVAEVYSNGDCSNFLFTEWGSSAGLCNQVGLVLENLFAEVRISTSRPLMKRVLERHYFNASMCAGEVHMVQGISSCLQTQQPTGLAWLRTNCNSQTKSFRQQWCVVADCSSGCSSLETSTIPLFECSSNFGSSFQFAVCDSAPPPSVLPNPGFIFFFLKKLSPLLEQGLPGILPPLSDASTTFPHLFLISWLLVIVCINL
jgi:hypothetical protein